MKKEWNKVTVDDVKKAIDLFDRTGEKYPEPRNTFLLYNGKEYPAKHIRGLAYKVANKKEISKNDYTGGKETADFLQKLGFTVLYKKELIKPTDTPKQIVKQIDQEEQWKQVSKKLDVVSQKNALQRLLQKYYGHIETEKRFDWLKTPNQANLPKEYLQIVKSLSKYRNQNGFQKSNYQLSCDIVLEDSKLIIEYDEKQHFSKARQITLENYPPNINLYFSKDYWITACRKINAKDNTPVDRDERRAFFDTVRDIEAFKNGYKLVRIKHGDIDWEADGAENHLKKMISAANNEVEHTHIKLNNMKTKNIDSKAAITGAESKQHHKIARLVLTKKQCYKSSGLTDHSKLENLIENFINSEYNNKTYEFILTPGGFLNFDIRDLQYNFDISKAEKQDISLLQERANSVVKRFFENLKPSTFKKLKEIADYFTIGIDSFIGDIYLDIPHIELVAVYSLKEENVIRWTGKFYPLKSQEKSLIKIIDLNTHFIELNNQKVVLLGCHDLNVFSPRGQATAKGWRKQTADKFKTLCKEFKPAIILQHPHFTDYQYIWNLAWRNIEKELPSVKHYASGIKYYYDGYTCRGDIKDVLEKTKKGDVIDFYYD